MPTILGWRIFFYSNEGHEPIHGHAKKADIECKYWIDVDDYDIVEQWDDFQRRRSNE